MSRGGKGHGTNKSMKGIFGITAPSSGRGKGGGGRDKSNASTTAGASRAGEILAPPSMRKKPGSGSATSRKNNDGDIFTRQSPYSRPRNLPPF